MKNQGLVKTLIIILAVVSVALIALYTIDNIGGGLSETGALTQGDVANYGQEDTTNSDYSTGSDSYFTPSSGSDILVTDDGTVEMDSIPNSSTDAPAAQ